MSKPLWITLWDKERKMVVWNYFRICKLIYVSGTRENKKSRKNNEYYANELMTLFTF